MIHSNSLNTVDNIVKIHTSCDPFKYIREEKDEGLKMICEYSHCLLAPALINVSVFLAIYYK